MECRRTPFLYLSVFILYKNEQLYFVFIDCNFPGLISSLVESTITAPP